VTGLHSLPIAEVDIPAGRPGGSGSHPGSGGSGSCNVTQAFGSGTNGRRAE